MKFIVVIIILMSCRIVSSQDIKITKHSLEISYPTFSFFDGTPFYQDKKIYVYSNNVISHGLCLNYNYKFAKYKHSIGIGLLGFSNNYYKEQYISGDIINKQFFISSLIYSYNILYKKRISIYANLGIVNRIGFDTYFIRRYFWDLLVENHEYFDVGLPIGVKINYNLSKVAYLTSSISYVRYLYLKQKYGRYHYPFDKGVSPNNMQYQVGIGFKFGNK